MTIHREKLSAIIDGESFNDDIIDQLKKDDALADSWHSYHLMGDVMRNEAPEHLHLDFANQVAAALDKEPAILAPKVELSWRDRLAHVQGSVVAFAQQGGQFAVAATVAIAVIVGVQQNNANDMTHIEPTSSAPLIPLAINAGVSPVSLETSRPVAEHELMQQRRKINAYVLDHQQQMKIQTAQTPEQNDKEESIEEQNNKR